MVGPQGFEPWTDGLKVRDGVSGLVSWSALECPGVWQQSLHRLVLSCGVSWSCVENGPNMAPAEGVLSASSEDSLDGLEIAVDSQ